MEVVALKGVDPQAAGPGGDGVLWTDNLDFGLSTYEGLEGFKLVLTYPDNLRVWETATRIPLTNLCAEHDANLQAYSWTIGTNDPPPGAFSIYVEGIDVRYANGEPQATSLSWMVQSPAGSVNVGSVDHAKFRVEPIVWPSNESEPANLDDPENWASNSSDTWNGFELPPGWYIEKSLVQIINGSTGAIRTEYPQKITPNPLQPHLFRWEGTKVQNSNAWLDLRKLCGTADWGDNVWVRVEVEYDFDQSPNITVGQFVDTNLENRWQASFHHNSGIIFENRVEIQIFDTASLLTAIAGTNITLDGAVVAVQGNPDDINGTEEVPPDLQNPARRVKLERLGGGGPDSQTREADEIRALISGIPYRYDNLDYGQDETNMERLQRAPQGGQRMIIYVRKHDDNYQFKVQMPNHSTDPNEVKEYSVPISGDPDAGEFYLQSHWGSGVKFTSAKVTVTQETPTPP